MRSRKSTATLTLVLIGAAALSGCGDDPRSATRDVYRTQADCKRDWGEDDTKCERQSSGRHAGYFYGPSYGHSTSAIGSDTAARSGSRAMSSTTVSRGGLGSSASSHSSGG